MSYSEIAKYVGIIITGLAAIIGLIGDHRKDGKLTIIGKLLIVCAVLGIIIAITGDRMSVKDIRIKERLATEWSRMLDEPITSVSLDRYFTGEFQLDELKILMAKQEIAFGLVKSSGVLKDFQRIGVMYGIKERTSDLKDSTHIDAKLTLENCKTNAIITEKSGELCKLRVNEGWIEAYASSKFRWTKMSDYSCGLSGTIPWEKFSFPGISKVKDLSKLAFRFKTSETLKLNLSKTKLIENKEPKIIIFIFINTPSFSFLIDPASFGYTTLIDETDKEKTRFLESSISGHRILTYFRNQFEEAGGLHSDKIKMEIDAPLHVIRGVVEYVERSHKLIKL